MSTHKTTLVIVDDHPIVLEGLSNLLKKKEQIEIVGSFSKGCDFIAFLKHTSVQVVLLDIFLPDINGIDLCREIKTISPETLVLVFSNHEERSAILKMLENGARGYLLKSTPISEILACIDEALRGEITFSSAVKEIISQPPKALPSKQEIKLTVRELEILKLIATGMTTSAMAKLLFLSKFTVDGHRKNLLHKFGAENAIALISMARLQGLL